MGPLVREPVFKYSTVTAPPGEESGANVSRRFPQVPLAVDRDVENSDAMPTIGKK
jgi:hypothetical protein